MITRQGRSLSTVSSVLPNSDAPVRRGGSDITIARARISFGLLHDAAAALPRAHLLPVPGHPPPAAHARRVDEDAARASCSGIAASIGEFGGTEIVTSTWMPRRRRAASRAAVEIASGE